MAWRQDMSETNDRCFDTDLLMSHVGSDVSLLAELVDLFEEYYPAHLASVRKAVENCDATALREAAHQLKGAVSNFYAQSAVDIAQKLENAGRDENLATVEEDLERLESNLESVRRELRVFCTTATEELPAKS